MKSLLWTLFAAGVAANLVANLVVDSGGPQIAVSIVSGALLIGSGAGLWVTRDREA
ncbi:hypothetical protein [Streptomyces sp. NPDC050504]|uniref:hypothetical protein n=1 Tax=Streptomyces sp. NPDC050504 TaxID=3365618 RepID=UPI003792AAAD